jgi:TolA-binding protein
MIRRRRSPHRIALTAAWLVCAGLRARAAEETAGGGLRPDSAHETAAANSSEHKAAPTAPTAPSAETKADEKKPAPKRAASEVEGLLNLGASLTERGDFDSAEIAYRQVLNTPRVPETHLKTALLGLAHMHRKQGALTKAAAIFERFLKDYPGDDRTPDALLDLGRTLRGLGVYKLALMRFYSVINSTLKLPGEGFERYQVLAKTAQFEIAETHFQAGEFAEANKFYTRLRLLDLAPGDRARAHFKAGYALRLQGDLEGAITTFRSYLEQWPDDENVPEARYLLAVTLRELKRTQEAFAATLELLRTEKSRIATDPKRWAYWQRRTGNQLANDFFENGDTLNARTIYASLLDLSPEIHWRLPITYQVGLCDERLGANDRARAAYQAIVDAAGATPPAELVELVKMAAWRIEHLAWRDRVGQQVSAFFETTTGKIGETVVGKTVSQ